MSQRISLALSVLAASVSAQQIGTFTPEVHPQLPSQYCTKAGCEARNTSVVLDADYRWVHTVEGEDDCKLPSGDLDPALCPDPETCAMNCAVEGVDYASYGISTSGDSLILNLYTENGTSMASPRVYLLDEDEYVDFKLLNREFTYDVDTSKVPCGVNGALYFSEMAADGDMNELNEAGAAYGTGYCDAQCPKNTWVAGEVSIQSSNSVLQFEWQLLLHSIPEHWSISCSLLPSRPTSTPHTALAVTRWIFGKPTPSLLPTPLIPVTRTRPAHALALNATKSAILPAATSMPTAWASRTSTDQMELLPSTAPSP